MNSVNIHFFLTNILNQTRLFKEARYTVKENIFEKVVVLGLWAEGLPFNEITTYGLEIRRLPIVVRKYRKAPKLIRLFLSVLSLFQYIAAALRLVFLMRPSHVSCHNAIMLPVVWLAARVCGATLIYVPHELEIHRFGMSKFEGKITKFVEQLFIRKPRDIVVVCDPIADWYRTTYRLKNVHVVRNVPESDAILIKHPLEGGFRDVFDIPRAATVFIYQGLFGAGRGTAQLLEIFKKLYPDKYHLVLMGYGDPISQFAVEEAAQRYVNIHYKPAVPREWITSYTAGADIGIFISERASLSYQYSLPNKFFEYAHAGIPVIVSDNLTYLTNLINQHELGWSIPLGDLKEAIQRAAESDLSLYKSKAIEFCKKAVWESDAHIYSHVYRE